MARGIFDPTLVALAWFDPDIAGGLYDEDLVDATTGTVDLAGDAIAAVVSAADLAKVATLVADALGSAAAFADVSIAKPIEAAAQAAAQAAASISLIIELRADALAGAASQGDLSVLKELGAQAMVSALAAGELAQGQQQQLEAAANAAANAAADLSRVAVLLAEAIVAASATAELAVVPSTEEETWTPTGGRARAARSFYPEGGVMHLVEDRIRRERAAATRRDDAEFAEIATMFVNFRRLTWAASRIA